MGDNKNPSPSRANLNVFPYNGSNVLTSVWTSPSAALAFAGERCVTLRAAGFPGLPRAAARFRPGMTI
jgi:hypothetical protein